MRYPLAILTPTIGAVSETFVRRHVEDLLPQGTVVLTRGVERQNGDAWNIKGPILELDNTRPTLIGRLKRRTLGLAGFHAANYSTVAAERFLRANKVKVILGEYLDASLEWLVIAQKLGLRFFAHAHGHDVSRRLQDPSWRTAYLRYNEANGIITMSQFSRDRLIELGIEKSKIHVIPYGVDVPSTPTVPPTRKIIRCLAVGRMIGKKGPILVLDAFRRAIQAHGDLRLDFIGEGALLTAAQQFVKAFHLESSVIFHGRQSNEKVQQMLREVDMFIQHSIKDPVDGNEEGLPVAILEAMANGLPIIATCHAGIPESVEHEVTGYLVDEGDTPGMALHIIRLARDPELRRAMGHAGWLRAQKSFSWKQEQSQLLKVLGI